MLPSFLRVNRWSADATSRPSSWDPAELPRRYEKPAGNRGRSPCIWFCLRRSGVQRTHRQSTYCAAPQSGWRCRLLVVLGLLNESIPCSEISSGGGHHSAWGGRIPLSPPGPRAVITISASRGAIWLHPGPLKPPWRMAPSPRSGNRLSRRIDRRYSHTHTIASRVANLFRLVPEFPWSYTHGLVIQNRLKRGNCMGNRVSWRVLVIHHKFITLFYLSIFSII